VRTEDEDETMKIRILSQNRFNPFCDIIVINSKTVIGTILNRACDIEHVITHNIDKTTEPCFHISYSVHSRIPGTFCIL